jgi:NAD(P)-dependent dehydrogenase (short-subunit alcohol dehydrogenase family)
MGKFGLRALAQSMARELGPKGIHVAHTIIDGQIGENAEGTKLSPAAIAEAYWQLHRQARSAWTQELDLRPWAEKF